MNENYSIKDIITLLLNHILVIIVFSVVGAAAGYAVSKYVLPKKYSSHITMYVQSYTDISESADYINNISNSKQLVNTYIEVLKDDAVMIAVGDKLQAKFDESTLAESFIITSENKLLPASIKSCLAISSISDTSAINVTATAKNAEIAAFMCNALTSVSQKYVKEAVGVGSINTIDTAKVYTNPISPSTPKNTMVGGAAGFMLIVFVLFVLDFFDKTIKDPEDLMNRYKKAVIGEVEKFDDAKKKMNWYTGGEVYFKLTDEDIPFNIVENYKSIRMNVTFSLTAKEKNIFAVSSANPGDGVSTTAANIAIALAQSESKVLLIDADMRKPSQNNIFRLPNHTGLSAAIARMQSPDECIVKNVMENLDVMTSGHIPPNPSELLGSEQMAHLLDELSSKYSYIILDTPPVNVVSDAMELAMSVSGIIMVVRYGVTTDEDLTTAFKRLESAKMNLLGYILNGIKRKQHSSYVQQKKRKKYYYRKSSENGYAHGYYAGRPSAEFPDNQSDTDPDIRI